MPAGNIYDDAVNPTHKVESELSEEDLQTLALEKEKQDDGTSSLNQAIQKDYQKYLKTQARSTGSKIVLLCGKTGHFHICLVSDHILYPIPLK